MGRFGVANAQWRRALTLETAVADRPKNGSSLLTFERNVETLGMVTMSRFQGQTLLPSCRRFGASVAIPKVVSSCSGRKPFSQGDFGRRGTFAKRTAPCEFESFDRISIDTPLAEAALQISTVNSQRRRRPPLQRRLYSPVQLVAAGVEPARGDAELVRAFGKGEGWAARAIWRRHAPMVFRLLERGLGPDGDAEDLTQDVFLSTFERLKTLRDGDALRSFIYSVAVRTLKWELRRRRVRRILHLSDSGELPDLPVRGSDSEARQLLARFYALLEQLAVNDRAAFVLRHMEGLKLEEIADRMGVSLATVKRWVGRASRDVSALVEADPELSAYLAGGGGFHAPG